MQSTVSCGFIRPAGSENWSRSHYLVSRLFIFASAKLSTLALAMSCVIWLSLAMLMTLPMYDYPELAEATDAWASAIAHAAGYELKLSRLEDYAGAWERTDLQFSQTCGYPLTHGLRGRLSLVGTRITAFQGVKASAIRAWCLHDSHGPFRTTVARLPR